MSVEVETASPTRIPRIHGLAPTTAARKHAPGEHKVRPYAETQPYGQADRRPWLGLALLLASYLLVALGNEYTVLVPALQNGSARLLQSYKVYGALILWLLCLAAARDSGD